MNNKLNDEMCLQYTFVYAAAPMYPVERLTDYFIHFFCGYFVSFFVGYPNTGLLG